jgi:hypothetical protein
MKTLKSVRIYNTLVELREKSPVEGNIYDTFIYIEVPAEYDGQGNPSKLSSILLDTQCAVDVYQSIKTIMGLK